VPCYNAMDDRRASLSAEKRNVSLKEKATNGTGGSLTKLLT